MIIDVNKLTVKEIEEKLPHIDGITKAIAKKIATHVNQKIESGIKPFSSEKELLNVLKKSGLNSRYMPGVMDIIGIVGAGAESINVNELTGRLPNFQFDKLVSEMHIELPPAMRKFKKPEAIEITKPNSEIQQIQPKKDIGLGAKLCEINNLPEKREEPIKVINPLEYKISLDDFNGGGPLDNYERINLNGVDFRQAIENYIDVYGEERYYYPLGFSDHLIRTYFNINESFTFNDLYEYLITKGVFYFLYHNSFSVQIESFKRQYLGWGSLNNSSIYNIDEIYTFIQKNGAFLRPIIDRLKSELDQLLSEQNVELNNLIVSSETLYAERIRLIDYVLIRTEGFASQNEEVELFWHHVKMFSGNSEFDISRTHIKHSDTFGKTFLDMKIRDGFDIDELNNNDASSIFENLNFIRNRFQYYESTFGPTWNVKSSNRFLYNGNYYRIHNFKVRSTFVPFLKKLKAELGKIIDTDNEQAYEKYVEKREILNNRIDILKQSITLLNSDLITQEIISKITNYLSSSMSLKKHIPDFLSHAVMVEDANKDIFLITPPDNRLHNMLDYVPSLNIITEFSLEILHQKFGFGKHLYSESLFPGEEVSIEVSSKSKKEIEINTTSSEKIFEEANEKTSSDFQSQVNKELNDSYNKNNTSNKSVNLSAGGGFGGFTASASYNNSSSSSETVNNTAKKVNNITNKLAKELSDQRQITFEKSTTEKSIYITEEENKSTRKFVNINKERTLTFNFFQITREYQNTLYLEDIELLYSTGKFNFATIFINVEYINLLENTQYVSNIPGLSQFINKVTANRVQTIQQLIDYKIIRKLPSEFADNFEEGAVLVLYGAPYSETIPLSQANLFLANTFKPNSKAIKELNNQIWKFIGNGSVSPDGIGVGAFPLSKTDYESDENLEWPKTQNQNSPDAEILKSGHNVVADKIKVTISDKTHEFKLPNLDLCFNKVRHFRVRYVSTDESRNTLPLAVMQKNYVINTNGVYCENMLGSCGALEEYATKHRELDVEKSRAFLNQERAKIPPSLNDFKKDDNTYDMESYNLSVQNFCKIQNALNTKVIEQGKILNE